ncbi:formyltransferase family protein [Methanosarcina acetivorans]|uniref:Formyl transferase N-terminal domain-containing protein n=3 Tax=Methanosarcina acetivorans TaxID=2214 RepID=Q8THD3_METAC|nr:formyltransferase family protein [Methanosarcina acetivorans]AAM07923.1 hypothetical protein (multi-domain) [Methanosarcina acetivorans C2A]
MINFCFQFCFNNIRNLEPDLIVVFSMSHLLKENVFNVPSYGTVNIHYSYLPEYGGPNPLFWQYYDYILDPGVTLHYVDKGEDTGNVIYQRRYRERHLSEKIQGTSSIRNVSF